MNRSVQRRNGQEKVLEAVCNCREGRIDAQPGQPCHRSIRVWLRSPGASLDKIGVTQEEFGSWDAEYCRIHPEAEKFQT